MIDAGLPTTAFFTDRRAGTSPSPYESLNLGDHVGDAPENVARNRALVAEWAGTDVIFMRPEHGTMAAVIDGASEAQAPIADVLVTARPGIALATLSADCAPILMHHAASGTVAAAHVGREGLFNGGVDAAVIALLEEGGAPGGAFSAAIGPTICGRCYEVPEQMRASVASRHPAAWSTTSWGTPGLDLPAAIEKRLYELGAVSVKRVGECTFEDLGQFSRRRQATTGRFAGVIVCEGPGVSVP